MSVRIQNDRSIEEQRESNLGHQRESGRVGVTSATRSIDLTNDELDWELVPSTLALSVVIPTLNESGNLFHVFERMPPGITEMIIVDGNSTDDTVATAKALWPSAIVIQQDRHGKGNALACGFRAASGDIIVMLDADGSTDPAEIPRFVAALRTGADFAKGTRFVTGGGSADITFIRSLGNRALAALVNRMWRVNYSDLCYGYNAFWKRCLDDVSPDCEGFEVETLINIKAARAKLKVMEVPSYENNRRYGTSNLNARRDGIRVLRTIIAERVRP
jgi:glycosyltransferase involved in cell wall biosynthesis